MPITVTVSTILARARFYLNDVAASYFSDTVLLPPFAAAYDDLREELFNHDIQLVNKESSGITITAGVVDIGDAGPALPTDLMVPIELWERLGGSTDDYVPMKKVQFLPKTETQIDQLIYWAYQGQIIKFIGATLDREVKIDYIANALSVADDAGDTVNMFNAASFLAYRTAALAAEFLGENKTRADSLNVNAGAALESLLDTDIKNQQSMPVRRRPFRAGYMIRGSGTV